ncbi:MAG: hypothetical protein ACK506_23995, partial [Pirellula sp.]
MDSVTPSSDKTFRVSLKSRSIWLLISTVLLGYGTTKAQEKPAFDESVAAGKAIPNPNDLLETLAFTRHQSVQNFLNLDTKQREWIDDLLLKTQGVPSGVETTSFYTKESDFRDLEYRKTIQRLAAEIRTKRREMAAEMLDPVQQEKLRLVALFAEVRRTGLKASLLEGFLGETLELNDGQKQSIEISLAKIARQYKNDMTAVIKSIETDLTATLSPEQVEKWSKLIGPTFYFESTESEARIKRVMANHGRKYGNYNPRSPASLSSIVVRREVTEELNLSAEQMAMLESLRPSSPVTSQFLQQLNPAQSRRLSQLEYRYEIFQMGIHYSLTDGRLGKALEITKSQAQAILDQRLAHSNLVREAVDKN